MSVHMDGRKGREGRNSGRGDERADMEQTDTSQPEWHAFLWSARGPYDVLVPSGPIQGPPLSVQL